MQIDLVVRASWQDESLVADTDELRYLDAGKHWNPRLQIVGNVGLQQVAGGLLEVNPDGTVGERSRYVGILSSRMDLSDFPLDRQVVRIEILLLQAIMTSRLASGGNTKLAQRFDDVCRWAFPAAFLCLATYSFLI